MWLSISSRNLLIASYDDIFETCPDVRVVETTVIQGDEVVFLRILPGYAQMIVF